MIGGSGGGGGCFLILIFFLFGLIIVTYILGKMRTLANVSGFCPVFSSLSGKLSAAIRDTTNSSRSV